MDCPRGGIATESTHTVTTLSKAQEWFADARENDLPITVQQYTTPDGRIKAVIYSDGVKIHTKG